MVRITFVFAISIFCILSADAKNLVKIGNTMITSEDFINKRDMIHRTMPLTNMLNDKYILDSIMLYQLGLMDAHEKKLELDPEAKKMMEAALFNYYLYKMVDEKVGKLVVSEDELRNYYKTDPDITLKRVVMPVSRNNITNIKAKISVYRSELNSGKISFDEVINRIGKHELSSLNGLFRRVSANSLPEQEKAFLLKMQPGEISAVIDLGSFVEIIQLVKRHPFSEASVDRVTESYKREKLIEGRYKIIEDLKAKYKSIIQYY